MKKEWMKPLIIDFTNSSVNSGTDERGEPERVITCVNGLQMIDLNAAGTGKSSTTFETCS